MVGYLVRRIALFLPTLFVISLVVFGLSRAMPGDPAERLTGILAYDADPATEALLLNQYERTFKQLGLNLPLFYFSINSLATQADLSTIAHPTEKKAVISLMYKTGRPGLILTHYQKARSLRAEYLTISNDCPDISLGIGFINRLSSLESTEEMKTAAQVLSEEILQSGCSQWESFEKWIGTVHSIAESKREMWWWVPAVSWNGSENQYHLWVADIFRGSWGYSLRDGRPVGQKIAGALNYTLWISFWSILLTFLSGVPIGLFLAVSERQKMREFLRSAIYGLYALPLFWIATLGVIFFTTDEYGSWTNIFPSPGQVMLASADGDFSLWNNFIYLILPILCLASGGIAFVARQTEQSAGRELEKRYITISRAKGNTEWVTTSKHLLPNAVFPLITLLGALIPSLISGSVVIEVIFNIPGMGRLLWDSIFGQDWNTVFAILLIGGLLTLVGQLIADILYARFNPKVRYD